jgi:uncharacterized short protein YbdD (DUF466 family)
MNITLFKKQKIGIRKYKEFVEHTNEHNKTKEMMDTNNLCTQRYVNDYEP